VAGNNTHGNAIAIATDGNLLALGTFEDPTDNNFEKIVLIKLDLTAGTVMWFQAYGVDGKDDDTGKSLQVNSAGNIIWAGIVMTPGVSSFIKFYFTIENSIARNESIMDSTFIGRDFIVNDIQPTETGFVAVGTSTELLLEDIYIIKINGLGSLVPTSYRIYSGGGINGEGGASLTGDDNTGNDKGNSIVSTSDGGMVILGTLTNVDATKGEDFYLIKTDVSGIPQWTKIIGGEGDEEGGSIIESSDGGLVFFGTSTLGGVPRMTLVKTDRNGNIQ